jgi:hypothetical protein
MNEIISKKEHCIDWLGTLSKFLDTDDYTLKLEYRCD